MFEGNLKEEILNRNSSSETVQQYVEYFTTIWHKSSSEIPRLSVSYSSFQKIKREKELKRFIRTIEIEIKKNSGYEIYHKDNPAVSSAIKKFLIRALGFNEVEANQLLYNNFLGVTFQFIRMAKKIDSAIDPVSIFQALRNVWTTNWLQLLFGLPIELTPAVFAYSMLYPYTDNYIDNPDVPLDDKIIFNERITNRLNGEILSPINLNEEKIFELIGIIESEFDRKLFHDVYESLMAIHSAQIKSLSLLDSKVNLTSKEFLKISIEKGGTSVLADGYLMAGNLTEAQKMFTFGYGAFLQLVDDLQDIQEDFYGGVNTFFTEAAKNYPLDAFANKTYNFGNEIVLIFDYFMNNNSETNKLLMIKSSILLMAGTIAQAFNFYTKPFLKKIETCSPFRFSFLRKQQNNYKYYNSLFMQLTGKISFTDSK